MYLAVDGGEKNNHDVASTISCIRYAMNRMGELDEALNHYVHALRIYERVRNRGSANDHGISTLKIIGMV